MANIPRNRVGLLPACSACIGDSVRGDGACPQLAAAASLVADGCETLPDRRGIY